MNSLELLTISELIRYGERELKGIVESAFIDSEILFSYATGLSKVDCITKGNENIGIDILSQFREYIERRKKLEPVAYITGKKEFWGLEFNVSPNVLIPRPETELLVELSLACAKNDEEELVIADIGTGSGCISISLATELKKTDRRFRIIASDVSSDALTVAKSNAIKHEVDEYIEFKNGSWWEPLKEHQRGFDIIVSNPPYIAPADLRVDKGTTYEPFSALYSGIDGLDAIRELLKYTKEYLKPNGHMFFEFGVGQEEDIARFHRSLQNQTAINFKNDLTDRPRVACLKRR